MDPKAKILRAVRVAGSTILITGMMIILTGLYVSDYNVMVPIGIGTAMGSIFIFLMGVFFVASEEMLARREKGFALEEIQTKKRVPAPALRLVYSSERKNKK
ncbi:hypothetical protein [Bacillus marinisedimentorum]|uniref:hypothetical protein n=1 Tax=Bacillus marinisedimentorum TaxID=1821260 RepID=UPI0007DF0AA5|nr:hypothetical protein [Bacillus marinisedimentorum]